MCDRETGEGCSTIDLDFDKDTIETMWALVVAKLTDQGYDACSLDILAAACDAEDFDDLAMAIGTTVLNRVVVEAVERQMEEHKAEAETTDK